MSDDLAPAEIADPVEWARRWILADREAAELAALAAPGAWVANDADDNVPPAIFTEPTGSILAEAEEDIRAAYDHIVRHDPRDAIARCDAELAILDAHKSDCSAIHSSCTECSCEGALAATDCFALVDYPCRTVLLLVSGYRHRPGYREEWGL